MLEKEFDLLEEAIAILNREGFRGVYGGEAEKFFDVASAIEKVLPLAEPHLQVEAQGEIK